MDSWIQTHTGRRFDPFDPRPEDVDLRDIAHALAHQCRFNGHTDRFYSVAQHSVLCSRIVPRDDAAHALLHDAAEAYTGDWVAPIKRNAPAAVRQWFDEMEYRCWVAVAYRFGIALQIPESVKRADLIMLATECRDVMGGERCGPWGLTAEPLIQAIDPWDQETARRRFMGAAEDLGLFAAP